MGHVIRFAAPPAPYPSKTTGLDTAEAVLLIAIRWWVVAFRHDEDPIPRLSAGMARAGAPDAAFSVDGLMTVVARGVRQPITVHCPRCPHVAVDEAHLLHAASLAQNGEGDLAEHALRTALLSGAGAAFALGPLEGLGDLFARARLRFSRRQAPGMAIAPWVPLSASLSVH